MDYVIWKDSFNVGSIEMDEQHKSFLGYINEVHAALKPETPRTEIDSILDKLTNYIKEHFTAEEHLLYLKHYPGLESQKKQHACFITELDHLKSNESNQSLTTQNLLTFVREWFLDHIMTEDKKYTEFI